MKQSIKNVSAYFCFYLTLNISDFLFFIECIVALNTNKKIKAKISENVIETWCKNDKIKNIYFIVYIKSRNVSVVEKKERLNCLNSLTDRNTLHTIINHITVSSFEVLCDWREHQSWTSFIIYHYLMVNGFSS